MGVEMTRDEGENIESERRPQDVLLKIRKIRNVQMTRAKEVKIPRISGGRQEVVTIIEPLLKYFDTEG
jgi:hypothetical protein